MEDDSEQLVALPGGKFVPAIDRRLKEGHDKPQYLLDQVARFSDRLLDGNASFLRKLATDRRMHSFWDWLGSVQFERLDLLRNSYTVGEMILRSTRLPGKPGNMTPTQREVYFKKVRRHAEELSNLLRWTRFDNEWMTELTDEELDKKLSQELSSWGGDEEDEGHTVAYQVTPGGVYRHHYDYPASHLARTLNDVVEWTYWEDNWDGRWYGSSAPIAQANSASTPIVYFCCTVHQWFKGHGVEIPFPELASLANVALDLPPARQVDEDTARKQVRRFQARRAKEADL